MSQYTKTILEDSIEYTQNLLLDYLNQPKVSQDLSVAFGDTFDRDAGISILRSLNEQDSDIPQIEIRSATEINNAKAAYSFNTNTIYFSEEFILTNANDPAKIARVYLEEVGHYLDFEANITDAPGDEGAIFSSLVTGEELGPKKLSTLQAEDDTATINLDGTEITVEQADAIIYVDLNATGEADGSSWANAYTDLPDAIAAAEATDQVWVAAGTYQPTEGRNRETSFVLPDGVQLYGGFAGDETSLEQRDVEANVTELTGDIGTQGDNTDNSYIVVDISQTSETSRLDGFRVADANNDESSNSVGGGILSLGSSATLANLTITDNIASNGAGIAANNSELQISGVVLSNNSVTRDGGGFYSRNGNSTLSNVTFIGNSADDEGGAVYNSESNDVSSDTEFRSNRAEFGGAIFNSSSDIELTSSSFFNNSAIDDGGAIFNSSDSNPNITNVDFVDNSAMNDGGAIFNDGGSPVIIDAVFADNLANSSGGALYSSGNHTVANSLFTGNVGLSGGGIFNLDNSSTVVNSTFSDNTGRNSGAIAFLGDADDTPSVTNSIIYDNPTFASDNQILVAGGTGLSVTNSLVEGGFAGEGNLDVSPEFVAPDSFDYRLGEGSSAIDAGNDEATVLSGEDADTAELELTEDLAGNPRTVGDAVDLGAYEGAAIEPVPTQPTIASETNIVYVNLDATGEDDGSSWANAYTDLQAAIENAPSNSQIWVAAGTYTPTLVANDERRSSFVLPDEIQVYGGFAGDEANLSERDVTANTTILSGDLGTLEDNSDNSAHVVTMLDTSSSSVLDGFTITGGNADVQDLGIDGGGIFSERSQAILRNLIVTNNTAAGLGGGMYIQDSFNQLTNVDFVSNTANSGGAVYNNTSGTIFTDTTFEANSSDSSGGAILNEDSSIFIDEAVFTGNLAGASGGAVYNADLSNSVINDALFEGNSSGDNGGAVYNADSSPVLTNVEFRSNNATATGGAIYTFGEETQTTVANGIFEGNTAEFGGAIYSNLTNNRGINLTFANNVATLNGGAIYTAGNEDTTSTYTNTIVWNNAEGEDIVPIFNDATETVISQSIVEGGYEGTDIIDADPLFVDGEAVDLRLSAESPAIDAGTIEPVFQETDIAGFDRVVGEGVDLGAYEYFDPAEIAPTVFRFFRPDIGVHFYTSDETERDSVLENLSAFEFEGPSFIAAPPPEEGQEPLTGVEPVYRFLNNNTGVHVYTIDEIERDAILELPNFTDEGIAYYGYETEQEGTTPLYRFYNPEVDAHFYTPQVAERDFVSESLTNYQPEGENGIAYYVLPLGDTAVADI